MNYNKIFKKSVTTSCTKQTNKVKNIPREGPGVRDPPLHILSHPINTLS